MRVPLSTCCVVSMLTLAVSAQESQPDARAEFAKTVLGLEAREPEQIAWGAWRAGKAWDPRYAPHLRGALETLAHLPPSESRVWAALQVLHAALVNEVVLDLAELDPHLLSDETRPPTLALVARNARERTVFFSGLRMTTVDRHERQLAGNVLAKDRVPGFAAAVLYEATIDVRIVVGRPPPRGCMVFGTGRHLESITVPDAFPPTPFFQWCNDPGPDDFVLPGRNAPIGLRVEWIRGKDVTSSQAILPDVSEHLHLDWLADLLERDTPRVPLRRVHWARLVWRDAASYRTEVVKVVSDVRDAHRSLVAALLESGALTPSESRSVNFAPQITVHDARQNPSEPLPELPADLGRTRR